MRAESRLWSLLALLLVSALPLFAGDCCGGPPAGAGLADLSPACDAAPGGEATAAAFAADRPSPDHHRLAIAAPAAPGGESCPCCGGRDCDACAKGCCLSTPSPSSPAFPCSLAGPSPSDRGHAGHWPSALAPDGLDAPPLEPPPRS